MYKKNPNEHCKTKKKRNRKEMYGRNNSILWLSLRQYFASLLHVHSSSSQRPRSTCLKRIPGIPETAVTSLLSALNGASTICECDVTVESILSPAAEAAIGPRYHVLARAHVFASSGCWKDDSGKACMRCWYYFYFCRSSFWRIS